jgi:hypothetical protein
MRGNLNSFGRFATRSCVCIGIWTVLASVAAGEETQEGKLVRAAYDAANTTWRQGRGRGVVTVEDGDGAVLCDARFDFVFKSGNCWIDLAYNFENPKLKPMGSFMSYNRRVVLTDAKSISFNVFSPRILPAGSEINKIDRKPGSFIRATEAIHWDLAELPRELINLDKVGVATPVPTYSRAPDGAVVASYPLSVAATMTFRADKEAGFNITGTQSSSIKSGAITGKQEIQWKEARQGWHITSIIRTAYEDGKVSKKTIFLLTDVDLETPIPADALSFHSLAASDRGRIIDRHRDAENVAPNANPKGRGE